MTQHSPFQAVLSRGSAKMGSGPAGPVALHYGDPVAEYRAGRGGAGLVDLWGRTTIEFTGDDRVRFLNNLCTGDVKALKPGTGCEAFVTSAQAKIIGHVVVLAGAASLFVDAVSGQDERLLGHFQKYLIADDVQVADRTVQLGTMLLTGPQATRLLESVIESSVGEGGAVPSARFGHARLGVAQVQCRVARTDPTPEPGLLIVAPIDEAPRVAGALLSAGAVPIGAEVFDVLRVEAGTPEYGRDISEANLPQEVGRDAQAISFTKGCYLGQETVARIDSYGHVNQQLVGLRFDRDDAVPAGTALIRDGKEVGRITSAVRSPRLGSIGLGYARRGNESPGTVVETHVGEETIKATVSRLPFEDSSPGERPA